MFDDWIHVNNSVVDGLSVFLLFAKAQPTLDANFECVEDFGWVSKIACNPDFDRVYFLLEGVDGSLNFHRECAFFPKKN